MRSGQPLRRWCGSAPSSTPRKPERQWSEPNPRDVRRSQGPGQVPAMMRVPLKVPLPVCPGTGIPASSKMANVNVPEIWSPFHVPFTITFTVRFGPFGPSLAVSQNVAAKLRPPVLRQAPSCAVPGGLMSRATRAPPAARVTTACAGEGAGPDSMWVMSHAPSKPRRECTSSRLPRRWPTARSPLPRRSLPPPP